MLLIKKEILFLTVFIFEAILAKGDFWGFKIGFIPHMLLSALMIGTLSFIWGQRLKWQFPSTKVKTVCLFLIAVALVAAMVSNRFYAANLIFTIIWAFNMALCLLIIPGICSRFLQFEDLLEFMTIILLTGMVGCLLDHKFDSGGRFVGIYSNASWSGSFLALTAFHFLFLYIREKRFLWIVLFLPSIALLIMTRTRSALFGFLVAIIVMIFRHSRLKFIFFTFIFTFFAVLAYFSFGNTYKTRMESTLDFFRVGHGIESFYMHGRGAQWREGLAHFMRNGVFGEGLLSKFNQSGTSSIFWGIEFPTYDWETYDDPLMSVLLIDKQVGVLGAPLYILLLIFLICEIMKSLPAKISIYFLGFYMIGVTQSLAGSWLLSYGDSFERLSFVCLGIMLCFSLSSRANTVTLRRFPANWQYTPESRPPCRPLLFKV